MLTPNNTDPSQMAGGMGSPPNAVSPIPPNPTPLATPADQGQVRNNKEQVQKWLSKIEMSEKHRNKKAEHYRWKDFIEEYKGNFRISDNSFDIPVNPLNFVFAYVKTEIPALYLRDPHIKVNAKNAASIDSSRVLEISLNYLWKYKKLKRENKKNILDGKIIGHSWFKTGYTGKFGTVEDGNGQAIEEIISEDYFGYRIPWDCITFDIDSVDPPRDSKWIAHTVWAPIADIKTNPRYKNTDKVRPQTRKWSNSNTYDTDKLKYEEPMGAVREVWDIKNKQVFTISDGVPDYLEDPKPWPYEMRGYPFSFLCFNPLNDEAFGLPDVYMFEPQVLELMKIRALQLDHIKRYNRQLITTPNNLTQEQKDSLMLGMTGNIVEAQDPTKLFPIPYPPLQTDIYGIEERLKEDMINISGQSPQERGATQKTSTRTFRELAEIQKGAENRRGEQIDIVEDFVEDIAANLVALLQQFADVPYYVRVTGKESQEIVQAIQSRPSAQFQGSATTPAGFTFTKEDIQGEFDIEVVAGSTAPMDKNVRMDTLMSMADMAIKAGAIPGGPFLAAIARLMIEEIGMPELEIAMKQEVQAQQEMKQMRMQQQQQAIQMQTAQAAAQTQIEAEKVANRENATILKAAQHFYPQQQPEPAGKGGPNA